MQVLAATTNNEIIMAKNWFAPFVCLVAALMFGGCSHQPVTPATSGSQAAGNNAPAVTISPGNPDDIIALGKRLTKDRLSLYSVTQGKYTFYVGGVLSASYETASEILRISPLTAEEKVLQTCEYSPQGVLYIDPKDQANKDAFVNTCDQLVIRLNSYLSR